MRGEEIYQERVVVARRQAGTALFVQRLWVHYDKTKGGESRKESKRLETARQK